MHERMNLMRHLARRRCKHPIKPLACVHIHMTKQLLPRHRLWVHNIRRYLMAETRERRFEDTPYCRLAAAGGADDDDAHSLLRRLVEL